MKKKASEIQKERIRDIEGKAEELLNSCEVVTLTSVNEKGYPRTCLMSKAKNDGFTDIYQDMKDFVLLYQKPLREAKKVAVWEMRELFQAHWGFRIVNLLKVLHYYLFSENRPTGFSDTDGLSLRESEEE